MRRPSRVTSTDIALLRSIGRERSVVAASERVGITRDLAVYRLGRLARAFGGPVTRGLRGGREHGRTTLTPLGDRIARGGFDEVELLHPRPIAPLSRPNLLAGRFRAGPPAVVEVGPTLALRVTFAAHDGERLRLALDPETILVARRRFPLSARNVLTGRVIAIRRAVEPAGRVLAVRTAAGPMRVALAQETIRALGLRAGSRVYLYVKATALRAVGGPPPAPARRPPRRSPARERLPTLGR